MGDELMTCLTCRLRVAVSGGCCLACYGRRCQAVTRGEMSRPDQESRGLVTPARRRGQAWRGWQMERQLSAKPQPTSERA